MVTPTNLVELRRAVSTGRKFSYRFFWNPEERADGNLSDAIFSQWTRCHFVVDGESYTSTEQYMMAEKARVFGDEGALAAIRATFDPGKCKALGRAVRNFDRDVWTAACEAVVTRGNLAKFRQTPPYREYLLATGEDVLVEASPHDRIWGIGLGSEHKGARNPLVWRGQNLLGFVLMRVRQVLREQNPEI